MDNFFFPVSGLQGRTSEFYSPDHMAGGPLKSMSSSDLATAIENVEHAEESKLGTFLQYSIPLMFLIRS